MKHKVSCLSFRACARGSLLGFVAVRIDALGLVLHGVSLHRHGDKRWIGLPSRPVVIDSVVQTHEDGKIKYALMLEIEPREYRAAFAGAVWADAIARFPEIASQEAAP
jgi:hypothetical protein